MNNILPFPLSAGQWEALAEQYKAAIKSGEPDYWPNALAAVGCYENAARAAVSGEERKRLLDLATEVKILTNT